MAGYETEEKVRWRASRGVTLRGLPFFTEATGKEWKKLSLLLALLDSPLLLCWEAGGQGA